MYEPIGLALGIFRSRHAAHENETWKEACERVAIHVSNAEDGENRAEYRSKFEQVLHENLFMPGGRIWYGSGRAKGQLLNCFVTGTQDSREGWGKTIYDSIVISGTGGGVGINCSPVRPRGTPIRGTGGMATGAVSLMEIINAAGEAIKAGGGRRTALMLCLSLSHGDIVEFLDEKLDKKKLNNANISVVFDEDPEEFFKLVKKGRDFPLMHQGRQVGSIPAAALWERIVANALDGGEPGLLNGYLANKMSNVWYVEPLTSTNPCGEIWLSPYDCCCLGALVLPRFLKPDLQVDWELLSNTVKIGVRFLDDVLTVNQYPLPEIQQKCGQLRRIGLGITGLHHMLLELGMTYNSPTSLEFVDKLMKFIKNEAYNASSDLAKEKGSFPVFDPDRFLKSAFVKQLKPTLRSKIQSDGMRNCAVLTIAPTGTISMICDVSSGIEPVFAPAYERRFRQGDELMMEVVVDPMFQRFVTDGRDVQHFQGAHDISIRDHMEMQRICQKHVDNAVSKCLAAGTLIPTNKGLIPIEQFSNIEDDDTFVDLDGDFLTGGNRIIRHYRAGLKPSLQITTDAGAELTASADSHRILTIDGWKLLKDLEIGDKIIGRFEKSHGPGAASIPGVDIWVTSAKRIPFPSHMSIELAEWLGMICADGHTILSSGVGLTMADDAVEDRFRKLSEQLFGVTPRLTWDNRTKAVRYLVINSRNLAKRVRALIGADCYSKYVPDQILQGSVKEKLAFLRGVTLDGHITDTHGLCVINTVSEVLAYQVAELCRSFGIPKVYQGTKPTVYNTILNMVMVSGELQSLIDCIEKHKNRAPEDMAWEVFVPRSVIESTKVTCDHPNYSALRALKQDKARQYCTSRVASIFGWSTETPVQTVTGVMDVGLRELYDIEVEHSHNYTVNGMVSHNTINLPPGTTAKELAELYVEYLPELKGVTVYPEGSRENQPLTPIPIDRALELSQGSVTGVVADKCRGGTCEL